MTNESKKHLLHSWFVLLALTGASFLAVSFIGNVAGLMPVLVFAMFKARLVVLDFMGLRGHATMRRALLGWCAVLALSAAAKAALATVAAV